MDAMGKQVGDEIRAMAARKRMSIAALARALDLPQTYVARRVDGRAAFTPAELARVAAALGVGVADLLPPAAREVPPAAVAVDWSALDLNALETIAAALGVSVASLIEQREVASAGAGGEAAAPPPRHHPEEPGDGDVLNRRENKQPYDILPERSARDTRRTAHTHRSGSPKRPHKPDTDRNDPRRPRILARTVAGAA